MSDGFRVYERLPGIIKPLAFPLMLVYVVVLVVVLVAALVGVMVWLAVTLILALPRSMVRAAGERSSFVVGSHVEGVDDDDLFGSAQDAGGRAAELAPVGAGDPTVDDGMEATAVALWRRWQESFVTGQVDAVRPVMTEGFWRLHRLLLQSRADGGIERHFDGDVNTTELVAAHHFGGGDEIRVLLSCRGTCVDRVDGHAVRGVDGPAAWSEQLTLRRDRHGRSSSIGVLPSTCFNCGAPLHVDDDSQCSTCGALVAARAGDWVLANSWRSAW